MIRAALRVGVVSLAMVAPAWAQGTGISVLLVGDIVRFGGSEVRTVGGGGSPSRDGEALTFGLRVDQALGSRWGVELEYVRGAEIESDLSPLPFITGAASVQFVSSSGSSLPFDVSRPNPSGLTLLANYRVEARRSTVSSLGWYRQPIGERASLVYSAGIAFVIQETETTYDFRGLPFQNTLPAVTNTFTSYSAAPIVGVDGRVSLTDHASVVPGVRVVAVDGGLLIRPSVGLRWQF